MSLANLQAQIPDYAKDLRLNLESVLTEQGAPGLTQRQIAMSAVAAGFASRHAPFAQALKVWADGILSETEQNAVRIAFSLMSMTNIYYRFTTHLVSDAEYRTLRTSLRMNAMANPGCEKVDFETASLAVSIVNGCGMCVDSHEKGLRQHGVSVQGVQSIARIAATVHAVAVILEQA